MSFMDKLGTDAIINVCGEKAKDGTKYVMNKVLGGNKEDEQESGGGPGLSTLMDLAGGSGGNDGLKIPGIGNFGGGSSGGDGGLNIPGIGNFGGGSSGGDSGFSLPGLDKADGDSGGDGGLNLGDLAKKGASLGDFFGN